MDYETRAECYVKLQGLCECNRAIIIVSGHFGLYYEDSTWPRNAGIPSPTDAPSSPEGTGCSP
jgi:hypothetical protein